MNPRELERKKLKDERPPRAIRRAEGTSTTEGANSSSSSSSSSTTTTLAGRHVVFFFLLCVNILNILCLLHENIQELYISSRL